MKRKVAGLLLIAMLVIISILSSCKNKNDTKNTEDAGQVTKTTTTSSDEKKEEPLSIKTPGGAVLVGKIKKDNSGWYFEPEQKLDVELNYYEDMPEYFKDVTKINLYEEDLKNKNIYMNETVTVTGILQNYRNSGYLYLYLLQIEYGKKTDIMHAEPELDYPDVEEPEYDPSVPLPEKMKPVTENGHYIYNPYILSQNTLMGMGNDFTNFFMDFVDAWMSYKTSIPCTDKNYADMFYSVMFYEFPLFTADGEFDYINAYDEETRTFKWSYTSKSKEEHDRIIEEFTKKMNEFLKDVNPEDSCQKKVQTLYHAFASPMTYDYEIMDSRKNIDAYYGFTLNKGICVTFALGFSQLLSQIGVDSTVVSGDTKDSSHLWTLANIDNKDYFFDITFELNEKGFLYYGMTLEDRLNDGSGFKKDSIVVGGIKNIELEDLNLSDKPLTVIK